MKKCYSLFLLCSFVFLCAAAQAATVRVNSSKVSNKANRLYADLQECHNDDAIRSGDTLLVEGSIKPYSKLTCTKRLIIIGPGYFLTENPNTQANALPALVQNITFNKGSEGSVLIGLAFSSSSLDNFPRISVDNITVMRCLLSLGISLSANVNNLLILQNYFDRGGLYVEYLNTSFSGLVLKNNVFAQSFSISEITDTPRTFATVEHNIFLSDVRLNTSGFRNNIIASKSASVQVRSSAIQNNLAAGAQLDGKATNQKYQEASLFVGVAGANKSTDGQYAIKSDSPYLKAGYNGVQPGIFGGSEPYMLSGIPPIPTVYEIHADAVATKDAGLKVTIKAKANQ
jgi:hypothetical protein